MMPVIKPRSLSKIAHTLVERDSVTASEPVKEKPRRSGARYHQANGRFALQAGCLPFRSSGWVFTVFAFLGKVRTPPAMDLEA